MRWNGLHVSSAGFRVSSKRLILCNPLQTPNHPARFITIFVATLAILQFHLTSFSLTEVVFEVVSAFSTSGISTGYVSPGMPVISKWIFIGLMWIGRLEVIPVVMLFIALVRDPE